MYAGQGGDDDDIEGNQPPLPPGFIGCDIGIGPKLTKTHTGKESVGSISGAYSVYATLTPVKPKNFSQLSAEQQAEWERTHQPQRTAPVKTAFIAWWFIFGPWKMIKEVPYDPYLYFYWEESVYAARLWTNWYNIYAPNKTLVWHYFEKSDNRPRHWNDNEGWSDLESLSVARCKSILW